MIEVLKFCFDFCFILFWLLPYFFVLSEVTDYMCLITLELQSLSFTATVCRFMITLGNYSKSCYDNVTLDVSHY